MKQTVNFSDFTQAFHQRGRGEQFSYEALQLIFDYMEECEQETGEEIELDVTGICCEIIEMSVEEICDSFNLNAEEDDIEDYLSSQTTVLGQTDSGFVFVQF
jgi:hypothetical protein